MSNPWGRAKRAGANKLDESKSKHREDIQKKLDEFLANGGTIQKAEPPPPPPPGPRSMVHIPIMPVHSRGRHVRRERKER